MSNVVGIRDAAALPRPAVDVRHATLAGFCASLVGLGLARFAYTPLLPAIIDAHWFTASAASYLGAANLAGYLAGALVASPMAARTSAPLVLRSMMVLTTIALLACAWPVDFLWFFAWRFLSGLAGGSLMVLAAPTILAHVAPERRGLRSGVIFMGVGLGIAASGTLMPLLLHRGLSQTWIGLSVLSLALTLLAWSGWPARGAAAPAPTAHRAHGIPTPALRALYLEYALNAVALVPHMIFLVDFVARERGQGLTAGSQYWVLFGLGAVVGPLLGGVLADRVGFKVALRFAFLAQAIALGLTVIGTA
jgi:predicted MFS family arabinose efflux permease